MKIKKTPSRLPKVLPRNPAALPAKMRRAGTMTNRNEKRSKEPTKFEGWAEFDPKASVLEGEPPTDYGWDPEKDCPFCFEAWLDSNCQSCHKRACDGCEKYCCNCYGFLVAKDEE